MIEPIALVDIKADLRLEPGATDEDERLVRLITAARRMVETITRRTIVGENPTLTGDDLAAACQAISMIVGTWYAMPEGVVIGAGATVLPLGVSWILDPLVQWATD